MYLQLALVIVWCLGMSSVALAYGEYASVRQSRGRPISVKERFRNFLILFAACVGVTAFLSILWTQLPLDFVLRELQPIAIFALAPILLWYCFDLPLRLARHLSGIRKSSATAGHPLDGSWSSESSFLDQITEHRGRPPGVDINEEPRVDGLAPGVIETPDDRRSPALDRVARLRRVEPPSTGHS